MKRTALIGLAALALLGCKNEPEPRPKDGPVGMKPYTKFEWGNEEFLARESQYALDEIECERHVAPDTKHLNDRDKRAVHACLQNKGWDMAYRQELNSIWVAAANHLPGREVVLRDAGPQWEADRPNIEKGGIDEGERDFLIAATPVNITSRVFSWRPRLAVVSIRGRVDPKRAPAGVDSADWFAKPDTVHHFLVQCDLHYRASASLDETESLDWSTWRNTQQPPVTTPKPKPKAKTKAQRDFEEALAMYSTPRRWPKEWGLKHDWEPLSEYAFLYLACKEAHTKQPQVSGATGH